MRTTDRTLELVKNIKKSNLDKNFVKLLGIGMSIFFGTLSLFVLYNLYSDQVFADSVLSSIKYFFLFILLPFTLFFLSLYTFKTGSDFSNGKESVSFYIIALVLSIFILIGFFMAPITGENFHGTLRIRGFVFAFIFFIGLGSAFKIKNLLVKIQQ